MRKTILIKLWKKLKIYGKFHQIKFLTMLKKKIIYIHALQPNQYLLNSKILTEKEKKLLNYPKYGNIISKYYNQLNLENLKAKNLIDLRYLFKNNTKDLYRDYCCHLNNLGMHLISLEIIKNFEKEFQSLIK